MRMEHCETSEDKSKFCILRAESEVCNQFSMFKKVDGGDFSHSRTGSIKVKSFSLYGNGVEDEEEREYQATIVHQYGCRFADIHFVVTWNVEAMLTVSDYTSL